MNDLKTINDTYGHEKGDVSIKNLCQYICRVFKHSPVFRVGGDEFIVVLEHTDFMDRKVLIETLREEFRKSTDDATLEPWEKVSAAVGYAVYDPETDSNANSVLKRADAAMYGNKRQFKDAR
jgi:diguanylate cyclase (GGDEF)-like protein